MSMLDKVIDTVSDGIIITDCELNIVKFNEKTLKEFNCTENALLGYPLIKLLNDDNYLKQIKNENKLYEENKTLFFKNRRIRCSINASSIVQNGEFKGIIIAFNSLCNINKKCCEMYKAMYNFNDIITIDSRMIKIINYAKKAAYTDCNILLEGESGTGKEVFAQAIHNYSKRANGPFVAVNCAAIPNELIESELFGYEKGAFTGAAQRGHKGKFEIAHGGTLFLDEIGDMPSELQSKLLRAIDTKTITPIGGTREKKIDVRIISATNRILSEEVNKKNFRFDLYYRLNVISIHLISLRYRREDIELLTQYFIEKLNLLTNNEKRVSLGYIELLKKHSWPGNIRELKNTVERAYYLCDNDVIDDDIIQNFKLIKMDMKSDKYENENIIPLEELEKKNIICAVNYCNGNISKAADMLQIGRATLYRKIKKYCLKI